MNKSMEATLARIKANIEQKTQNTNIAAHSDPRHELTENSVTKSNALCRAYYRFGLVEKRCMEAMISKLNPLRSDNIQEIELKAIDYAKAFSVDERIAYRDLASAAHDLMRRVISTEDDDGKGRTEFTLMSKARYRESEGRIVCMFNPLIVPHLMGLYNDFAKYPLKDAANFSSSYTWRFYELLVSWAQDKKKTGGVFVGWLTIAVDELRQMMGMPDSYQWVHVNSTLEKVTNELKEKAHLSVKITNQKTSRKITHLKIEFIEDEQIPMPLSGGELPKKPRKGKAKLSGQAIPAQSPSSANSP
ncbi:replication initiation protein (plasmid) [Thiothrix lacustris]|uniref:Replication initiation protein n=1 Tax=Thiothrix lacustris TaxID=525917 RepID=A0ABY9MV18_9GAMM|nr:replication initiation protein [Thiothrix lacustris]WML92516.1 replication initiation protein [Thiothrix lacustris]